MNLVKDNLTIRNAMSGDAEQLCTWWNNGEIMAHAGYPNGLGETPESTRKSLAKDSDETCRRHIIEQDGYPIGEMVYRNKGGAAEIGIKICEVSSQEKGIGTVLLTMFIDALFTHYGYEKVILDTSLTNKRAQHVYENKLGFKKLRINENAWRDQLGKWQSAIDYEMTKEDWLARQVDKNYIHLGI
ncbi:MAG: GNAT family N-acetyltransferase [Defluviitaleaceae bacterium]|nr:GNAT family N-acetyltransferase [Defluviitaleaceae bacterium]